MTRPEEGKPPQKFAFNPLHHMTLAEALYRAKTLSLEELMALLLFYGSHSRNDSNQVAKEVARMKDQIEEMAGTLTNQVVELAGAYSAIGANIESEVMSVRARLEPGSDAAIWVSLKRIEELVQAIRSAETNIRGAAAQPRTAPAPAPAPGGFLPSSF